MFFRFQLNPLSPKVNCCTNKSGVKDPSLVKIAQVGRHDTVNIRSEHYSSRAEGSIPIRANFFAEFIVL